MTYKISPTLNAATAKFFRDCINPDFLKIAQTDDAVAKSLFLTSRTFQEGAFWAAARICQVYEEIPELKTGPESQVLKVILEIMAAHAEMQAAFEACKTSEKH